MVDKRIGASPPKAGIFRPMLARDLVARVFDEMPRATRQAQLRRFNELLDINPHCQSQVNENYFERIAQNLLTVKTKSQREKESATRRAGIMAVVDLQLLDMKMINGKRMRDCTGAEMAAMGQTYQRIAQAVGMNEIVGDKLCENEVRALVVKPRKR
jgi:hypothetical protein